MKNLYPLVRALNIDPWEIFYPELEQENLSFRQLRIELKECSDGEIAALLPVLQAALAIVKSKREDQARGSYLVGSDSLSSLTTSFKLITPILVVFPHLGQKRGKFSNTVSCCTFCVRFCPANGTVNPIIFSRFLIHNNTSGSTSSVSL